MNVTVYLLTGSNRQNPITQLAIAERAISRTIGKVSNKSAIYKTAPWGNTNQEDFYNQVLEVEVGLSPVDLMLQVLLIEKEMGRKREEKWGPRLIDIDILFYADAVINEHNVVIPHPLLHERRFVLAPLSEIAPNRVHPILNKSVSVLLETCPDKSAVEKL